MEVGESSVQRDSDPGTDVVYYKGRRRVCPDCNESLTLKTYRNYTTMRYVDFGELQPII